MKKIIAAGIVAGATALALTGCGHHLDHGVVTGKEFHAAHNETYFISIYCGKSCFTMIPETQYVPDEYTLDLKDGKQTGTTDVDQTTFDRERIGQVYP